jgi:hypothetical protein
LSQGACVTAESIINIVILTAACALGWALWRAGQPKPVFNIRVVDGAPQATEGTITPAFLQRVREVFAAHEISGGVVRGYAYGIVIRLRFSQEVTEPARQQLRNWWATFGWPAPRRSVTRRCS